jgi:pimeloyl-ACP methyl ester carboxylesterase
MIKFATPRSPASGRRVVLLNCHWSGDDSVMDRVNRIVLLIILGACLPLMLQPMGAIGQPSVKSIKANGVELHYVEKGSGVAVIFVHGGLDDYRAWDEQVGPFSEHYRAIAYSRRYNYPNTGVAFGNNYSAEVDAEDLAALIKGLELGPAHLVGASYGAYVALLLAAKHPELVRSMVLAEPPLLRWLPEIVGGKALYDEFMRIVWEPTTRGFRKGNVAGVTAAVNGFGALGYSGTEEKMTFTTLPPEVRSVILDNAAEWKALTMSRNAFPPLPFAAASKIDTPTLLLGGQRSLRLANVIDGEIARRLPHGQRIVLAGATHEMWNEYPEECRTAAMEFIDQH